MGIKNGITKAVLYQNANLKKTIQTRSRFARKGSALLYNILCHLSLHLKRLLNNNGQGMQIVYLFCIEREYLTTNYMRPQNAREWRKKYKEPNKVA